MFWVLHLSATFLNVVKIVEHSGKYGCKSNFADSLYFKYKLGNYLNTQLSFWSIFSDIFKTWKPTIIDGTLICERPSTAKTCRQSQRKRTHSHKYARPMRVWTNHTALRRTDKWCCQVMSSHWMQYDCEHVFTNYFPAIIDIDMWTIIKIIILARMSVFLIKKEFHPSDGDFLPFVGPNFSI